MKKIKGISAAKTPVAKNPISPILIFIIFVFICMFTFLIIMILNDDKKQNIQKLETETMFESGDCEAMRQRSEEAAVNSRWQKSLTYSLLYQNCRDLELRKSKTHDTNKSSEASLEEFRDINSKGKHSYDLD